MPAERRDKVDRGGDEAVPVTRQCQLLSVNRSTVYYQRQGPKPEDVVLMRCIDEIHLELPFLGRHRMVDELAELDFSVNHKRVQRLMRLMGISAIYRKPRTSLPGCGREHRVFSYLLSGVPIWRPNQVWSTDVTFIPMPAGFAYLVAIMDVYSRKILAWRLGNTLDARLCVEALEAAIEVHGVPEIFNSDQGSTFTSSAFIDVLQANAVRISMDGRGRWIDNVFIERFWRSLKYECVYLHAFDGLKEARQLIADYMAYYNQRRKHTSLKRQRPDDVYNEAMSSRPIPATVHRSGALSSRPCS